MLLDETILSLSEAAKSLPPVGGKRPHSSTIWRWCTRGTRGVRLESARLGGRWVTTRQALERFALAVADRTRADLAASADADDIPVSPVAERAIHVHEIEAAERACDRAGIRA